MQLQWLDTVPADSCLATSTSGLSKTPGVMTGERMDITKSLSSEIRLEYARARPIFSSPQCPGMHDSTVPCSFSLTGQRSMNCLLVHMIMMRFEIKNTFWPV